MALLATLIGQIITVPAAIIPTTRGKIEFADSSIAGPSIEHERATKPPTNTTVVWTGGLHVDPIIHNVSLLLLATSFQLVIETEPRNMVI
jgi:hypothetical protein